MTVLGLHADALDLPFQHDAGMVFHPRAYGLAKRLDIGGSGAIEIDEEVAVQLRHLRLSDAQAAATGIVHQLPGAMAWRVLEGRAAGAVARLARFAFRLDLGHFGGDLFDAAGAALE